MCSVSTSVRLLLAVLGLGGVLWGWANRSAKSDWQQVLTTARDHLEPWFAEHVPELSSSLEQAFVDAATATDQERALLPGAWARVREVLYLATVRWEFKDNGTAHRVSEYWVQPPGEEQVQKMTFTEELESDDLPDTVRIVLFKRMPIRERKLTEEQDGFVSGMAEL